MSGSSYTFGKLKSLATVVLPIVLFALGPQIILWYERGTQWQGAYATFHADEYLYSSYLNSLIEGRPRRNDPFTAKPDQEKPSLPETAFSVQIIPPLVLWLVGKPFGLSASTLLIALAAFAAGAAAVSIYFLLLIITDEERVAGVGMLLVLTLGTMAGGQGLIGVLLKLDIVSLGFPFLRRYQPAFAFGLFFAFCSLIWLALNADMTRKRVYYSILSGLVLVILTFSYLYLWTTAISWLLCLAILWLFLRWRVDTHRILAVLGIAVGLFGLGLWPYFWLLSQRSSTLDELQTMISTRQPDLIRIPEVVGVVLLILLVIGVARGRLQRRDPRVLFAASMAFAPLIVFNQQVLTGKSMQPFHFEVFIVNYIVLVGLVIAVALFSQPFSKPALMWLMMGCLLLGVVDVALVSAGFHRSDVMKDRMVPAARRLKQLAESGVTNEKSMVFSPHIEFMQMLPAYAPQGTLLGMGSVDFGSATHEERKEFLFTHLYYSGITADRLREIINGSNDQLQLSYYVRYVIFGHERVRPLFSSNYQPITNDEIENEVKNFGVFVESFSRELALKHRISFAVISRESNFDFSYIDRWYQRSEGEQIGDALLYRLAFRE